MDRWTDIYGATPLVEAPFHFASIANSPFTLEYLTTILKLCPRGGRSLETGIGTGFSAIWLSLRGICAEGLDYNSKIVERARQVNNLIGGRAQFRTGDLFHLLEDGDMTTHDGRYNVIHHQGVVEHFTVPQIRAALAQQVASADWVVFSVPSVYYPYDPEFGDERLLPLSEWEHILSPFDVHVLRYYGDPQHSQREHVLCVLRGSADVCAERRAMMQVSPEPFPLGISAVVHTRNEAQRIRECLESLEGWTDQIIVCDMESTDETVQIAREFTQEIIEHPLIPNFDRARNVSAMRAGYRWIVYLDADERAPAGLGERLRRLVEEKGSDFEAAYLPFRHHFAGHWMQCLYPGYTAPRLLKNGKFYFNARLHSGVVVEGRAIRFPADDPNLALVHYSFDSLSHYLDKLNRYTDGEALNMHRDGLTFSWQNAVRHFVADFRAYYDQGQAHTDAGHGFIYSFLSAFYRFEQHAKLFERRYRAGQLQPAEQQMPTSVEEILEFALAEARRRPDTRLPREIAISDAPDAAAFVWSGPLESPSGYGEESRHLLVSLAESTRGNAAGQVIPWGGSPAQVAQNVGDSLSRICDRPAQAGFVHIVHDFPAGFYRHPAAGVSIGRTVFETDRLPYTWVDACNSMDYVWVASKFNQETFGMSGVQREKLRVIPECLDPYPYRQKLDNSTFRSELEFEGKHVFLSLFDWTLHKGWDVLLSAFLQEFCDGTPKDRQTILLLKVWSTMGYDADSIRQQAATYCKEHLGIDLARIRQVRFMFDKLSASEMIALYKSVDCYVMPSRGEGWGRPYMEAMAAGLPTIATNWSGNTEFMTEDTSYLLDNVLVPVPERGWREVPTYRGHRWAEPSVRQLRQVMREIVDDPVGSRATGARASDDVALRFSHKAVGKLMADELVHIQQDRIDGKPHVRRAPTNDKRETEVTVRWEGAFFRWHSLAHVNRELCTRLIRSGRVDLSLIPIEPGEFGPGSDLNLKLLADRQFAPTKAAADVHVRHFFPPRWQTPVEGHFVLMQPWEYGFIPLEWIEPIKSLVSEVWCNSNYVKKTYLDSGIPEEKLKLVPLGVDTAVFHPQATPYVFTTEIGAEPVVSDLDKRFVFLYVGGSIHRKGIDVLLDAYRLAFSQIDDVCLIIKDTGTKTVYKPDNYQATILSMIQENTGAPMIYLDADLPPHTLAGIYTASDCLVAPYRGEGFCLPVLEAMACGVPAIVPAGGPTDDFVDESCGWRIDAELKPTGEGAIGQWECAGPTWMFEVSPIRLARLMRIVAQDRNTVRQRGIAAWKRVQESWTWDHSVATVLGRLEALRTAPPPVVTCPSAALQHVGRSAARSNIATEPLDTPGSILDRDELAARGAIDAAGARRPVISLCMIVRDEERVLADCLASITAWVDEIIVVDTGSTDCTADIARSFGAKVFHFPWTDSFSAARNESLRHATGDWVLWMDADDTIPEECGRQLHNLALLAEDRLTGYIMQVHIPAGPGQNGMTVVDHVKLFRNLPGLAFEGRIHEQILEPIHRLGGSVARSSLYIVHSGYDYSSDGQQKKRTRDLLLLQKDLEDRPDHPFVLFNIGMTAYHMKDYPKAEGALRRCLAVSKSHESTVRKVYAMLSGCYAERGLRDQAEATVEQGLKLFPRDPELLFRGGVIYKEFGKPNLAEKCYLDLFNASESGHIDSLDVSMKGYKAHHNLALVYLDLGRPQEAELAFKNALIDNPGFVPSLVGLGEVYLRTNRNSDVRTVVEALRGLDDASAHNLATLARLGTA